MSKDRRTRDLSGQRYHPYPFKCGGSSNHRHPSSSSFRSPPMPPKANVVKEWEEARCSVCMEHPHNAVVLSCSSHDKGCQAFMCDTSYRHSNCLDQFRKVFSHLPPPQGRSVSPQPTMLSCPLCRGRVTGWTVVEPARRYMNAKARSCSLESCRFSGTYQELRKHARKEHPLVCPSDVDPERQRDWTRMERQQDIDDLLSAVHSAIGGEETGDLITGDVEELEGDMNPFSPPYPLGIPSPTETTVLWWENGDGGAGSDGSSSDGMDERNADFELVFIVSRIVQRITSDRFNPDEGGLLDVD